MKQSFASSHQTTHTLHTCFLWHWYYTHSVTKLKLNAITYTDRLSTTCIIFFISDALFHVFFFFFFRFCQVGFCHDDCFRHGKTREREREREREILPKNFEYSSYKATPNQSVFRLNHLYVKNDLWKQKIKKNFAARLMSEMPASDFYEFSQFVHRYNHV